jgi:hypothetical protein
VTESSTPRDAEPHRRAPDPAGTRPKVDLKSPPPPVAPIDPSGGGPVELAAEDHVSSPTAVLDAPGERAEASVGGALEPKTDGSGPTGRHPVSSHGGAGPGRVQPPHASRFQFLTGGLLALGLSAIAITVLTLHSDRAASPAAWSDWHPTETGYAGATQIANHVAIEYRLPSKAQMVTIEAGPPVVDSVPVALALQSDSTATGDISVLDGSPVFYHMCGLGPSCSIAGTPSLERGTLLRREALELALDTFEYVDGADQVLVLLPPTVNVPASGASKTAKPTYAATDAMFFEAPELHSELGRPLSTTMTRTPPPLATIDSAPDTPTVNRLTAPSLFTYKLQPQSDSGTIDSVLLVMAPLASG